MSDKDDMYRVYPDVHSPAMESPPNDTDNNKLDNQKLDMGPAKHVMFPSDSPTPHPNTNSRELRQVIIEVLDDYKTALHANAGHQADLIVEHALAYTANKQLEQMNIDKQYCDRKLKEAYERGRAAGFHDAVTLSQQELKNKRKEL